MQAGWPCSVGASASIACPEALMCLCQGSWQPFKYCMACPAQAPSPSHQAHKSSAKPALTLYQALALLEYLWCAFIWTIACVPSNKQLKREVHHRHVCNSCTHCCTMHVPYPPQGCWQTQRVPSLLCNNCRADLTTHVPEPAQEPTKASGTHCCARRLRFWAATVCSLLSLSTASPSLLLSACRATSSVCHCTQRRCRVRPSSFLRVISRDRLLMVASRGPAGPGPRAGSVHRP